MKNICYVYTYSSIHTDELDLQFFLPHSQSRIGLLARCVFLSLTHFSEKIGACIRVVSSIFCHIGISFIFFKKNSLFCHRFLGDLRDDLDASYFFEQRLKSETQKL